MLLALTPAPLMAATSNQWGRPDDANKLLEFCREGRSTNEYTYCIGYISGAVDGLLIASTVGNSRLCVPDQTTLGQYTDAFVLYASRHPEKRNSNAATVLGLAIFEFWPCS